MADRHADHHRDLTMVVKALMRPVAQPRRLANALSMMTPDKRSQFGTMPPPVNAATAH
jgi:hypothetical protein